MASGSLSLDADITLVAPDGSNADTPLKTGSLSVEDNGKEVFSPGADVVLHLSDVSATGLVEANGTVNEDGLFSLADLGDSALTGADDDGCLGTASGNISITLDNSNDAPEISGALSLNLDSNRSGNTGGTLIFSDANGDSFSLSGAAFGGVAGTADGLGGFTVNGAHGVLQVNANGTYSYTLNPGSAGLTATESFSVSVTDQFGAVGGKGVQIDLLAVNADPVASADEKSLDTWRDADGLVTGSVSFSDADGDAVTVASVSGPLGAGAMGLDDQGNPALVAQGLHGALYLHGDGGYRYLLTAGHEGAGGAEVFGFTVSDAYGGTGGNSITINLDNLNSAPVFSGDLDKAIGGDIAAYPGGLVWVQGSLAWTDAEGDAIASVSVGGTPLSSSGPVTVAGTYGNLVMDADGGYSYTLNPGVDALGVTATESFALAVTDEFGASANETLNIALSPLSHPPVSQDLMQDWPYMGATPLTAVNNKLVFSDVDTATNPLETLTLAVNGTVVPSGGLVVSGEHGNLTIQVDGTFSYVPHNGKLNTPNLEEFSYTVTDAADNSSESSLYIRLSDSAPNFPVATSSMKMSFEDSDDEPLFMGTLTNVSSFAFGEDEDSPGDLALPVAGAEAGDSFTPLSDNTDETLDLSGMEDLTFGDMLSFDGARDSLSLDALLVTLERETQPEGGDSPSSPVLPVLDDAALAQSFAASATADTADIATGAEAVMLTGVTSSVPDSMELQILTDMPGR